MPSINSSVSKYVRRAAIAAAIVLTPTLQAGAAAAADWYTGATAAKPSDDWIVAVDASATATSTGSQFAGITGTFAPTGSLNASGLRARVEGLVGTYAFATSGSQQKTRGDQADGSILAGYEWVSRDASLSTYGGLTVRGSRFSDSDPGHAENGTKAGAKGVFEYYARPSDRTMLSAYASYSSVYNAYYARLKWGVMSVGQFYVGPEVAALGDDFYRQWRLGAHLSGFQLGALQFGISAGYLLDKDGRGGGYGALDVRAVY